jgi:hypothetical protein
LKIWYEGCVAYEGEVASFEGSLRQAQRDAGQCPGGDHWLCVARAGRDGLDSTDGADTNPRGVYDTAKTSARLDKVSGQSRY